MKTAIHVAALFLATLCVFYLSTEATASERIGVLLDEKPQSPLRVESDEIVEIIQNVVGKNSVDVLVATANGIVRYRDTDGRRVDLDGYDAVCVYQGDEIAQTTPLFDDAVVAQLRAYEESGQGRGLLLLGGAVALLKPLGLASELSTTPLTFGEDRAQLGLAPVNPGTRLFETPKRGVLWLTNAAFPAFARVELNASDALTAATSLSPDVPNPLVVFTCGADSETTAGLARVLAYGVRVSPLFDSAADEYQENFRCLIGSLIDDLGKPIFVADLTPPQYVAPDFDALERALAWFDENFDEDEYPRLEVYTKRLAELREASDALHDEQGSSAPSDVATRGQKIRDEFSKLQKEALLDNPDIDFDEFLYISRNPKNLGLPENYNSNSVIAPTGYQNVIRRFNFRTDVSTLVYQPLHDEFVGDIELYYDASKIMFSEPDVNAGNRWRVWELELDKGADPRLMPLINEDDVDNYDACYLPDDRVIFCSTACMSGVPCINGSGHVCNLYLKNNDGTIRQLTLEQDHDWNPVVMNNGRVMYLRWEYVDLPHAFSRIMFHMNPDGTNQTELYGSGSYWPNAIFYARPLPGDSGKFAGIVTGHHELNRQGELVIFDPNKGRKEASGVERRIPGWGETVSPIACDLPIAQSWPKFLHPYPISENAFLVAARQSSDSDWEICLVDVFDNIVPLLSLPGEALLEPIPIRETERQPILSDRTNYDQGTADVFISDVYEGEGLRNVPRGEVAALRIFSYEFAYQGMGAEPYSVGLDGPWDPRRIIGTTPVHEDGSASFKIPALTPISIQPLDKNGNALQIMRSWITALPGESVSCIGCHETQNSTNPTNPRPAAALEKPLELTPFYGEPRGFSFEREIQPILNRYCVECHSPESATISRLIESGVLPNDVLTKIKRPGETFELGALPDFTPSAPASSLEKGNYIANKSPISNAYYQLRRFVTTPTKESEMPTHVPCEFHADSQPLAILLKRGHYGVELDPESWDKLCAWMDLNAPFFGNWGDILRKDDPQKVESQSLRREELRLLYAPNVAQLDDVADVNYRLDENPVSPATSDLRVEFEYEFPSEPAPVISAPTSPGEREEIELSEGVALSLVSLPGTNLSVGAYEVTNEEYRIFDPTHDSGIEYGDFIQFSPGERGWSLNRSRQPVVRVSQTDAQRFCEWLSEKTGDVYRLPTLAEAKAIASSGSASDAFWFGNDQTSYGEFENLADSSYGEISGFGWRGRTETLPGWRPVDWEQNDNSRVASPVGSYRPNGFGLFDLQGNVSEWTSTDELETRITKRANGEIVNKTSTNQKVAYGGSWRTRAQNSKLDAYRSFPEYFKPRDVGFRVVRENKSGT